MPLPSDRVLLKQGRDPLLTFGLPLPRRLPLSFLQDELLIGGLGLVLVVDGPSHMLPQSDGDTVKIITSKMVSDHKKIFFFLNIKNKNENPTVLIQTRPAPLVGRCSGSVGSVSALA